MLNQRTPKLKMPNPEMAERRLPFQAPNVPLTEPNKWFADRFPEQTSNFGSAFLEAKISNILTDLYIPVFLNDDFFAAAIGGDRRLGHQIVYAEHEDVFYFFDYGVNAFCPVSEAKLKILASNLLIRCAQDSRQYVEVENLVVSFRKEAALENIVQKAKAILEVDRAFFEGKDGKRRFIHGKHIEPTEELPHELFVKKAIVRSPESRLTVATAFSRYHEFCRENCTKPLTRGEFKDIVTEAIREMFNLGLRHDIVGDNGKQTHGWDGLACSLEPAMRLN